MMQPLAASRVYLNMDIDNKTSSLNGSATNDLKRLTPSELRERLLHEQEARNAELVNHNAELTKSMEHEREQSRLYAEANAKALEADAKILLLLEKMSKQLPASSAANPTLSSITSAAGNLIALAVIAGYSFLPAISKFLFTAQYPELTPFLRLYWVVQTMVLIFYAVWTVRTIKTNSLGGYVSKAVLGIVWLMAFIYQCFNVFVTYRYHSLQTFWGIDFVSTAFAVVTAYAAYYNLRTAWRLWKTNKAPISQSVV